MTAHLRFALCNSSGTRSVKLNRVNYTAYDNAIARGMRRRDRCTRRKRRRMGRGGVQEGEIGCRERWDEGTARGRVRMGPATEGRRIGRLVVRIASGCMHRGGVGRARQGSRSALTYYSTFVRRAHSSLSKLRGGRRVREEEEVEEEVDDEKKEGCRGGGQGWEDGPRNPERCPYALCRCCRHSGQPYLLSVLCLPLSFYTMSSADLKPISSYSSNRAIVATMRTLFLSFSPPLFFFFLSAHLFVLII
jgi:hypothetical protein